MCAFALLHFSFACTCFEFQTMPKRQELPESSSDDSNSQHSSRDSSPVARKKVKSEKDPDVKVFSNKILDASKVPPKPTGPKVKAINKPFDFRLTFTNGVILRKFLEPAVNAVKKIRFEIVQGASPEAFTGFKIECHDQAFSLADRGLFECDVECNNPTKGPLGANGTMFSVNADSFMEALMSSTLKETDLRITRYCASEDRITFESTNNENDVRAVYHCSLVDSSDDDTLDGITIDLGFHATLPMDTLRTFLANAKRCNASEVLFQLWQAVDPTDASVVHSKMSIGFQGLNTSGSHDFYISARKEIRAQVDGTSSITWIPLTSPQGLDSLETMAMDLKCSNAYDNKKLRLFLNHMEAPWVLVHLCTDNTVQPLVLDCVLGGSRTKHTVMIAPKVTN
jgi:hypothetical protein